QLRRAAAWLDRNPRVLLVRAEERGGEGNLAIEQLPLRAELVRAVALGVEVGVALAQVLRAVAERVAGRVRRRCGSEIQTAVRHRLEHHAELVIPEVRPVLERRR